MYFPVPPYVQSVLDTLAGSGYEAYLVGGCVRDLLLKKEPHDYDLTSSAHPEQILHLYPDALTVGIKHGTVTVKSGHQLVEVTTFRADGDYDDHRHPSSVQFVGDVVSDLSRRDFTVNAIAIRSDGTLVDPFGGEEDLRRKIVRAVGNPDRRFEEDALRMFRAFRFCAKLSFSMDPATREAISRNSNLVRVLSAERVRDELGKILVTDHCELLYDLISDNLMQEYLIKLPDHRDDFLLLNRLAPDSLCRWALFSFLLKRAGCIKSVSDFLKALRLDNNTVRICSACSEILKGIPPETLSGMKTLLYEYGTDAVQVACECFDTLFLSGSKTDLQCVLNSGECFRPSMLALKGDDLKTLGYHGKALGQELDRLVRQVIEHPELNTSNKLLPLAEEHLREYGKAFRPSPAI